MLWQVNHLGSLLEWLQWPRAFVLLVGLPALALAVLEWQGRRARRESIGGPAAVSDVPSP